MLDLDSNVWYTLYVSSLDHSKVFKSTGLYDDDNHKGAVFFDDLTAINPDDSSWQLLPLPDSDGLYVLRTKSAGPQAFFAIGTGPEVKGRTKRYTDPMMKNTTVVIANEAYWALRDLGDGAITLSNSANGTGFDLHETSGRTAMLATAAVPVDSERFVLEAGQPINDNRFSSAVLSSTTIMATSRTSTVSLETATATASDSTTPAAQSTASSTPAAADNGFSRSGIVAVAISVTISVLILIGILFFLVRRKLKGSAREAGYARWPGTSPSPGGHSNFIVPPGHYPDSHLQQLQQLQLQHEQHQQQQQPYPDAPPQYDSIVPLTPLIQVPPQHPSGKY